MSSSMETLLPQCLTTEISQNEMYFFLRLPRSCLSLNSRIRNSGGEVFKEIIVAKKLLKTSLFLSDSVSLYFTIIIK